MQHTFTTSADGSSTLQLTCYEETYHSRNGAYTEAMHIYIQCGLEHLFQELCDTRQSAQNTLQETPGRINIFDIGFGTGLNCILAWAWQQQLRQRGLPLPKMHYYGIEKYPISLPEIEQLNYRTIIAQHTGLLPDNLAEIFTLMHSCTWEKDIPISEDFILHKSCADIASLGAEYYREAYKIKGKTEVAVALKGSKLYKTVTSQATGEPEATEKPEATEEPEAITPPAVVFYDTFSPATQPELWDEAIFRTIAAGCPAGSVLVTYCSKGTVKQALRNAGFTLERLAGPPGKRHILRGTL